jgi:RNA polymerase sigma-70 factor (ECF subfamily)
MRAFAEPAIGSDSDAFFREYFPCIYQCLSTETGAAPSDLEDLAQETLMSVWRGRGAFRGDSAFLTWVLAIARNKARDYVRRAARAARAVDIARDLARLETNHLAESSLETDEMRRRVRRALTALPGECSEVLIRRYFHGQSARMIARELDEPEKTVEARLHRARERLRSELMNGGDHVREKRRPDGTQPGTSCPDVRRSVDARTSGESAATIFV